MNLLLAPFAVALALTSCFLAAVAARREADTIITFSKHSAQDLVESYFRDPDGLIQFRNIASSSRSCFALYENGYSAGRHKQTNQFLLPDNGIILSTGNPEDFHINDSDETSTNFGVTTGDINLEHELPTQTQVLDPCFIQFEFSCPNEKDLYTPILLFDYVFGSEEYFKQQEQQTEGTNFNDVFGFFLNGENIALIPDEKNDEMVAVSINNVNEQRNSVYFVSNKVEGRINSTSPYNAIEADGFTTKLTAKAVPQPGWNIIKLVVGDVADGNLDSWVLLEAGTFSCAPIANSSSATTKSPSMAPIPKQSPLRSSSSPTLNESLNLPSSSLPEVYQGRRAPLIPKPIAITIMVCVGFFLVLILIIIYLFQ
jgi:hypothetical protein